MFAPLCIRSISYQSPELRLASLISAPCTTPCYQQFQMAECLKRRNKGNVLNLTSKGFYRSNISRDWQWKVGSSARRLLSVLTMLRVWHIRALESRTGGTRRWWSAAHQVWNRRVCEVLTQTRTHSQMSTAKKLNRFLICKGSELKLCHREDCSKGKTFSKERICHVGELMCNLTPMHILLEEKVATTQRITQGQRYEYERGPTRQQSPHTYKSEYETVTQEDQGALLSEKCKFHFSRKVILAQKYISTHKRSSEAQFQQCGRFAPETRLSPSSATDIGGMLPLDWPLHNHAPAGDLTQEVEMAIYLWQYLIVCQFNGLKRMKYRRGASESLW